MDNEKAVKEEIMKMGYVFHDMVIPEYMRRILAEYIINHKPVGGFLEAILSNDLMMACLKADGDNIRNIPAYIDFLYNYAPLGSWGSPKIYRTWIEEE